MSKPLNIMQSHRSILPTTKHGIDNYTLVIPTGEGFYECLLTIHESQPGTGARVSVKPPVGAQGSQQISVEWWQNGASSLRYQLEAFTTDVKIKSPLPSPTAMMTEFLPSRHGFHFINLFPPYPDIILPTPFGKIKIGNAQDGLCGGMVYTALDFFHASQPIPETTNPPTGDMLFDLLVKRLFESFNLPFGISKYIELMNSYLPDGETESSLHGIGSHGRAWKTIRDEWPGIKTILDAGQPCPLGLIRVKSTDYRKLGLNHQVLAYGYDVAGDVVSLFIYDPNYLKNDDIRISFNISNPELPATMTYSTGEPLFAFFKVDYRFKIPFSGRVGNSRILVFEQPNFAGRMKNISVGSPNLALVEDGVFNDQISSFIIVSGDWMFYKNRGFNSPYMQNGKPLTLGPGHYPQLGPLGIQDNDISSLMSTDALDN